MKSFLKQIKLLTICFLASLLMGCASLQQMMEPPRVNLTGIEVLELSGFSLRIALDLSIQNPNPVPIPITGLSYDIGLNGYDVLNGVSSEAINLGAYEQTQVRLEASANLFGMMGLLSDFLSAETSELNYQLEASIGVRGFPQPFDINETGLVSITN